MTPQELKNSILQLAIQGKLVEQRPEEGTAEELYQQIQGEKQRLIKAGTIKKEKPLPKITEDEKPFDIPESWMWVRLPDVTYAVGNKNNQILAKDVKAEGKYPAVSQGATIIDGYCDSIEKVITDLPLVMFGDHTRNVKYIDFSFIISADGTKFMKPISIDAKYLYYWMTITAEGLRNRGYARHYSLLVKELVPLPPLTEQKRIVAKIEELMPYIDRYEQAWSNLEDFNKRFPTNMQKSILQMAIQGKLVEQRTEEGTGEELYQRIQAEKQKLIKAGELRRTKPPEPITSDVLPFDFPESWKVCYIDDIAFVTKLAGFEYTKNIAPNLSTTGIPLFKGKNVQNGNVVLDFESYIPEAVADELPRSQIRKKCLLTPYVGTIGNIAIFDGAFRAHLGSNVGKIELLNNTETYILEEYVLHYLRSTIGYSELTKYKKATAQESISIDAIRNVIIAIPPLAEQKRIISKLEEILPLCEKLKR